MNRCEATVWGELRARVTYTHTLIYIAACYVWLFSNRVLYLFA